MADVRGFRPPTDLLRSTFLEFTEFFLASKINLLSALGYPETEGIAFSFIVRCLAGMVLERVVRVD